MKSGCWPATVAERQTASETARPTSGRLHRIRKPGGRSLGRFQTSMDRQVQGMVRPVNLARPERFVGALSAKDPRPRTGPLPGADASCFVTCDDYPNSGRSSVSRNGYSRLPSEFSIPRYRRNAW